tara:strand:+ start:414 stop:659 length:246 start_codon:yes stop_codon:yes gene_type:complete
MVLNDARAVVRAFHEGTEIGHRLRNHLLFLQRRDSDDPFGPPHVELVELRLPPGDVSLLIRADNEYREGQALGKHPAGVKG